MVMPKKFCKECGHKLWSDNTTGYCKRCVHIYFRELWKNEVYRNKVIIGVSKPRIGTFKKEQSERITQWYKDNPDQIKIRRKAMSKSWEEGRIKPSSKSSKIEENLYQDFKSMCPFEIKRNFCIKLNSGKLCVPDMVIEEIKVVIEVYGSYWHADPRFYKEDFIVEKNRKLAKEIWEHDKNRSDELIKSGWEVKIVWSHDIENNHSEVLEDLRVFISNHFDRLKINNKGCS